MNGLGPYTRRLVALSRGVDEPKPEALWQVEQHLTARVTAGAVSGTGAASGTLCSAVGRSAKNGRTVAGSFMRTKGMMVVAIGFAFSGLSRHDADPADTRVQQHPAQVQPARGAQGPPLAQEEPMAVTSAVLAAPERSPRSVVRGPSAILPPKRGGNTSDQNAHPSKDFAPIDVQGNDLTSQATSNELKAEARALSQAQQAMRRGDTTLALALLARQEERFPKGQLTEERAGARAMLLCRTGDRTKRRETLARFEQRFPHSLLVTRVISACENDK